MLLTRILNRLDKRRKSYLQRVEVEPLDNLRKNRISLYFIFHNESENESFIFLPPFSVVLLLKSPISLDSRCLVFNL
jgi:hypothetical protein